MPVRALIPPPTRLLSLSDALARRAVIFGPFDLDEPLEPAPGILARYGDISRRMALWGSGVAALGFVTGANASQAAPTLSANDARLVAITAELTALDRFVSAYPSMGADDEEGSHPAYYEALDRFVPLEDEMAALPADSMTGVLAKVRTVNIPTCGGVETGLADSVCSDLARLFAIGGHLNA